jgi:exodeoxyribonuclease VII large subunit
LKFKPKDGMSVLARGRVDVFEARGEYQLVVEVIEPQGHGALQFAFEQLKRKLALEGLFDATRKRTLPKLPRRIGLVTSATGAVIQDMLQILSRRFPGLHLRLFPVLVQGDGSVESVCHGIEYFHRMAWAQVVIIARGGGSLEDLWTFNEEAVARAIANCSVPTITAIGHETDFTIADFVADLRAPTPSAAAELVICTRQELLDQLAATNQKLMQSVRYKLAISAQRLHRQGVDRATAVLHRKVGRALQRVDELEYAMRVRMRAVLQKKRRRLEDDAARLQRLDLRLRFAAARRRLDACEAALPRLGSMYVMQARGQLEALSAHVTQLSPLKILDRGYAIVQNEAGAVLKRASEVPRGSLLNIRLAQGRLRSEVTESIPDEKAR